MGLTDATGRFRVGAAIKEALLNAIYRGNLEISFKEMQDTRVSLLEGKGEDLVQSGARRAALSRTARCTSRVAIDPEAGPVRHSRRRPGLRSVQGSGRRPARARSIRRRAAGWC